VKIGLLVWIFGNIFNFTINKQPKFKTILGAVFSLITLLVIILGIVIFGRDFYKRKNPKVLAQKRVPANYSKVNLNNKVLTLSWRIEDSNGKELDFSGILFPQIIYNAMAVDPKTKNLDFIEPLKILSYRRCNETTNEPNFYQLKNHDNWYCVNFDVESLLLGGYWDGDFNNYFSLQLNACKHDQNDNKIEGSCAPFEKI